MKYIWVIFLLFLFVVTACYSKVQNTETVEINTWEPNTEVVTTNFQNTEKSLVSFTQTKEITEALATHIPSVTATAIPVYSDQREKIRKIMDDYGLVQEYYLSDVYWKKMHERVGKYGKANGITALEFHGDSYNMIKGMYAMTPESFHNQMVYLMENDFHFVTVHELKGYLEGWLDLPKKSIILTSDSGFSSQNSFSRITEEFLKLEKEYGYKPHMQSYIWTQFMEPEEHEDGRCKDSACWEFFRTAVKTGFFTFGTHSQYHVDFSLVNEEYTKWDLLTSQEKIYHNLGLRVYALTWPFEACSPYESLLKKLGITIGFGGWTKPIDLAYVEKGDEQALCLPRSFPPNPEGISARPSGKTLEEMMKNQLRYLED